MYIGKSTVTSKGQVTIPIEIRERRAISVGADLVFIDTEAGILIKKASDLKEIFGPFDEIAKAFRLSPASLAKEIRAEKAKTLARYFAKK